MQIRTNSGIPNGAERAAKRIAGSKKRIFGKTGRTAKKPKYRKKAKYRVGQALTPLLTNALRSGKCAGLLTGNRPRTGVPHAARSGVQRNRKYTGRRCRQHRIRHRYPAPLHFSYGISVSARNRGTVPAKAEEEYVSCRRTTAENTGDRKNRRSEKARRHRYRDRRTISFASARNGTGRPSGPECRLWWRAATRARPDRISCR